MTDDIFVRIALDASARNLRDADGMLSLRRDELTFPGCVARALLAKEHRRLDRLRGAPLPYDVAVALRMCSRRIANEAREPRVPPSLLATVVTFVAALDDAIREAQRAERGAA